MITELVMLHHAEKIQTGTEKFNFVDLLWGPLPASSHQATKAESEKG